jgi:hypothetical protein
VPSLEYYYTEVRDGFPAALSIEDYCDALLNMNASEKQRWLEARMSGDDKSMGDVIRSSIYRQYEARITELAHKSFNEYCEAEADDHAELMRELRRARRAA